MKGASLVLLVAACGARSAPPVRETAPSESGSAASPEAPATGAVCGTRGAAECPANQFCSYEPGADCGETDKPGHCAVRTEMCAQIYQPVCGCDGKTYGNACAAAGASVGIRADGACK